MLAQHHQDRAIENMIIKKIDFASDDVHSTVQYLVSADLFCLASFAGRIGSEQLFGVAKNSCLSNTKLLNSVRRFHVHFRRTTTQIYCL